MKRLPIMIPALAITAVISAACGSGDPAGTPDPTATPQPSPAPTQAPVATPTPGIVQEVAYSDRERVASPEVPDADARELSEGNTAFALDLYQQLREEDGNLFYSPASISLALAMTYAGARGETEQQMADTLNFTLPQDRLHPAFNALDRSLTGRNESDFTLNIANALWGQADFQFRQEYLDLLATHYGAGMRLVDYREDPEAARQKINDWVEDQTEDRIQDLIPEGVIDDMTRLVLSNAIYFNAEWEHKFPKSNTADRAFTLPDGTAADVPTMGMRTDLDYADGESWQAVELPYGDSGTSMIVMLPDQGAFDQFEQDLDAERFQSVRAQLESSDLQLYMPKFEYEARLGLKDALKSMGMTNAFTPPSSPDGADLTGMRERRDLYIQDAVHKAFVKVDEEGTEAAAATGVVVGVESLPQEMRIDRPFIFAIYDGQTDTVLFLGRVLDPRS